MNPTDTAPWDIDPAELQARLSAGGVRLVDVREPEEWAAGHIAGALHVPLRQLPEALGALRPDEDIILYCKRGSRSLQALAYLREAGYTRLQNLRGGIIAWSAHTGEDLGAG